LLLSGWSDTDSDDGIGDCELIAAGIEEDVRAY
jgi:hypothetical protein